MASSLWLGLFVVLAFIATSHAAYTPLVLMHGIADTSAKMQHITELVQQHLPGIYVVALEVTGSKLGSIFTGSNKQVELICAALSADSKLAGGINVMGVSQGGILLRGYLERCNNPPVKNFISWVAPMMGVYGVPEVGHWEYLNVTLDDIADCCVYQDWAQSLLSFAGYWRDPFALDKYVDRNIFLADINNEGPNKNPTYKKNVLALDNFVMSYSTADTVLIPLETGWFGAYANGTDSQVVPLEKQPFYEFDYIGIRTLDQAGKLHRFTTDCIHEDYTSPCFDKYFLANVLPFLAS